MKGYIGFFDILGYQSFLKNNSDTAVQDDVLNFIGSLENPGPDFYKTVFPGLVGNRAEENVRAIFSRIKWLVFSDTVVYTLEPESETDAVPYFVVLGIARNLMTRMFDYGLPLRGALHFGEYRSTGHSMAGRGIVDAYELANKLNLSTCVLTQGMFDRYSMVETAKDPDALAYFNSQVLEYKTPLTGGQRTVQYNLKSDNMTFAGARDLREYVHSKFWAHGKDLGDARAVEKVEETERYIIFCKFKGEEMRVRART
jgi:hypothetical protein